MRTLILSLAPPFTLILSYFHSLESRTSKLQRFSSHDTLLSNTHTTNTKTNIASLFIHFISSIFFHIRMYVHGVGSIYSKNGLSTILQNRHKPPLISCVICTQTIVHTLTINSHRMLSLKSIMVVDLFSSLQNNQHNFNVQ
jgi:hypothetical protein